MTSPYLAKNPLRFGRHLALAIALASGTAIVGTLGFADVAHAQKKKDKKAASQPYSPEFVAAYEALDPQVKAGTDAATLKPKLLELAGIATSPDEKIVAGQMMYNVGNQNKESELQLRGLEMMVDSGQIPAESVGAAQYTLHQLHRGNKNYDQARYYLQMAIDGNFTAENITPAYLQYSMAQIDFAQNNTTDGLSNLKKAIETARSNGEQVQELWYKVGVQTAYENQMRPEFGEFAMGWMADYPSAENWRLAIDVARNMSSIDNRAGMEQTLDLMRLAKRVNAMESRRDFGIFIDTAKDLGYPNEITQVIDKGYDAGVFARNDSSIAEELRTAKQKVAEDKRDLAGIEASARKPDARTASIMSAGNTFLSYNDYAKAAEFFEMALAKPDVNRDEALQRMGMAQIGMGDYAAAAETLGKVQGERAAISALWNAYAQNQMRGTGAGG
ncbi:MAG: tetratricopeptide repeat protein [Erythrobacter sp.]